MTRSKRLTIIALIAMLASPAASAQCFNMYTTTIPTTSFVVTGNTFPQTDEAPYMDVISRAGRLSWPERALIRQQWEKK